MNPEAELNSDVLVYHAIFRAEIGPYTYFVRDRAVIQSVPTSAAQAATEAYTHSGRLVVPLGDLSQQAAAYGESGNVPVSTALTRAFWNAQLPLARMLMETLNAFVTLGKCPPMVLLRAEVGDSSFYLRGHPELRLLTSCRHEEDTETFSDDLARTLGYVVISLGDLTDEVETQYIEDNPDDDALMDIQYSDGVEAFLQAAPARVQAALKQWSQTYHLG